MKTRISCFFTLLLLGFTVCNALDCNLNLSDPKQVVYTITVDQSGKGNFTTIQSAVDSIPENNTQWIRIQISPGTYKEKVTVPKEKECLFFQGAGTNSTSIEWGDNGSIQTSPTVSFHADNALVTGISFKNTYNFNLTRPSPSAMWNQAVSAMIMGDRVAFYDCAFHGVQDTLWDKQGRHYFKNCFIEGSVDFIFGDGQSIYETCHIYVNIGKYAAHPGPGGGWITAQKRQDSKDPGGFVFKYCVVNGVGKTRLGRAWGPYATVIFYGSYMSDIVTPEGWDAWDNTGHESNLTYVEVNNKGAGSDTSRRVPWLKKSDASQLQQYLSISFINGGGWMQKLPLFNSTNFV